MKVPEIMSVDAWEAIAVPMQAALAEACREDVVSASQIEGVPIRRPDQQQRPPAPPLPAKRLPEGMIR